MCCKIPSQQKPAEDASLTEIWLKKKFTLQVSEKTSEYP